VIRSFTAESPVQTVSHVATMTGLDRSGARRMLLTLEALGYVQREGPKFRLTSVVLEMAHISLSTTALWGTVEPVLQQLVIAVQETCAAAVLDGTEIVHVAGIPGPRLMTTHVAVGSRLPAYCTSMGRILLGSLSDHDLDRTLKASEIRKRTKYSVTSIPELKRIVRRDYDRGWSFLNQELEEGLCAVAVPIVDRSRRIVAAINIVGNLSRSSPREMTSRVLPQLKRAAQEINSLLLGEQSLPGDRSQTRT
jgi:IclR family transcriptional regulator, pca regulon regulatory protein